MAQKLCNQNWASHRTRAPCEILYGEGCAHAVRMTSSGEHVIRRHGQSQAQTVDGKYRQGSLLQQKDTDAACAKEPEAPSQSLPEIAPDEQGSRGGGGKLHQ
jgi:hypothetical protein